MNGRRATIAAALVAISCWGAWWWRDHLFKVDYVNYPPARTGTWIAFGDSLTAGTGASEGRDYPAQLSARLGVQILNRGVPGETSADGLQRVGEILDERPQVVLLCFGGNDSLQRVPINQTVANLRAIISYLQNNGAFVVVIGVRSATTFNELDEPLQDLARETRTLHIANILEGVLGRPSLMADQIHPNDAGYTLIAERFEKILRPLLAP